MTDPQARPPRRRHGCGCLGVFAMLAGCGLMVYLGWYAVTDPWIYTVGRLRFFPMWEGVARVDGPGGTYRLYLSLTPANSGVTSQPVTYASGKGWVCGPAGQDWPVNVGGSAPAVIWKDMNGQRFNVSLHGQGSISDSMGGKSGPPTIDLFGAWQGNNIVLNDHGDIDRAFAEPGRLRTTPATTTRDREIRFEETFWGLSKPC